MHEFLLNSLLTVVFQWHVMNIKYFNVYVYWNILRNSLNNQTSLQNKLEYKYRYPNKCVRIFLWSTIHQMSKDSKTEIIKTKCLNKIAKMNFTIQKLVISDIHIYNIPRQYRTSWPLGGWYFLWLIVYQHRHWHNCSNKNVEI